MHGMCICIYLYICILFNLYAGTSKVAIPPEELSPYYQSYLTANKSLNEADNDNADAYSEKASEELQKDMLMADLESNVVLNGEDKDVYALGCMYTQILTAQHPFIRSNKHISYR